MRFLYVNPVHLIHLLNLFPPLGTCVTAREKLSVQYDGSCSLTDQILFELDWDSVAEIAHAHTLWKPSEEYQGVMNACLGSRTRVCTPATGYGVIEGPFKETILSVDGIFRDNNVWSPEATSSLIVVCDEDKKYGYPKAPSGALCMGNPSLRAYTFSYIQIQKMSTATHIIGRRYILVLCSTFFTAPSIASIDNVATGVRPEWKTDIGPWIETQEYHLLKQLYKFPQVCKPPATTFDVTAPGDVIQLARDKDTLRHGFGARQNGRSFTISHSINIMALT